MGSVRPPLLDAPPASDALTKYDREHLPTYLFLLDWSAAGKNWRETMEHLLGPAALADPGRTKKIYEAHLARAHWMTHTGYRLLLREE